jgi:DNA-binding transcriptional MerR regulator
MNLYATTQIVKLFGITPRQIHYWDKTNLIRPSLAGTSHGGVKYYNFINLVEFKTVKQLLEQGVSVQAVRKTLDFLRHHYPELKSHLSEIKLITNGKDIFAIDKEGKGIKAPSGQLVFVIPFGDYYKEVEKLVKQKKIVPAVSEAESLKFVSDVEFWQSKSVLQYIEKEVNKAKKSKSLSLKDVKVLIAKSHKRKASA